MPEGLPESVEAPARVHRERRVPRALAPRTSAGPGSEVPGVLPRPGRPTGKRVPVPAARRREHRWSTLRRQPRGKLRQPRRGELQQPRGQPRLQPRGWRRSERQAGLPPARAGIPPASAPWDLVARDLVARSLPRQEASRPRRGLGRPTARRRRVVRRRGAPPERCRQCGGLERQETTEQTATSGTLRRPRAAREPAGPTPEPADRLS
jgi:hypothetical protein